MIVGDLGAFFCVKVRMLINKLLYDLNHFRCNLIDSIWRKYDSRKCACTIDSKSYGW